MRDLYNRKKKLDYWTDRIHKDLDEDDKNNILKFFEIKKRSKQFKLLVCISIVVQ
jgi:hypothetical protein